MLELALRLETSGGDYTNAAGETASVYDVLAVAAVYDPENIEVGEDDGRPTLASTQTSSVYSQEFARHTHLPPNDYHMGRAAKGMYADHPVRPDDTVLAVVELLGLDSSKKVSTFIGADAVKLCIEQLVSVGCSRANYLLAMALLAINYAQREIPG
jgi:hypothetical protein